MRISDWSSDVCSSDLKRRQAIHRHCKGGAEFAASDVDQIGHHGRCGGAFSGTAPLEEQAAHEIALRNDGVQRSVDMRKRVRNRREAGVDPLKTAVCIGLRTEARRVGTECKYGLISVGAV